MRDQRKVIVLSKLSMIVGIVLAAYGIIADQTDSFRVGMLVLIVATGATVQMTQRAHVRELLAHTARVAHLTEQERQRYTEYGWRAAQIDALSDRPEITGGADIVVLPHPRSTPPMRRNGSA